MKTVLVPPEHENCASTFCTPDAPGCKNKSSV
jgi:hypothetical protein